MSLLLTILGVLVVGVGIVGLILPMIPGVAVIFLGILLIAWADDFTRIGPGMIFVMMALMMLALVADNVAGMFGARKAGASGWGVAGAGVGALLGLPFGLPGIILGPAVGALAFEYLKNPDMRRAGRAGLGGLFGFVLAILAKSAFAVLIIGLAVLAYVF